jgi:hypothetical protein
MSFANERRLLDLVPGVLAGRGADAP